MEVLAYYDLVVIAERALPLEGINRHLRTVIW